MDAYLTALSYYELRRFKADAKKILQLTEDFLIAIDTDVDTLIKHPNHNIINAIRLRDGLNSVLTIIDEELQLRGKND